MTNAELKAALLYAKATTGTVAINAMSDIDKTKVTGLVLSDRNFVDLQKAKDFSFDFTNEQVVLTYVKKTKDPKTGVWYDVDAYQIFPVSEILKVLVLGTSVARVPLNQPFGIATSGAEEGDYYFSKENTK